MTKLTLVLLLPLFLALAQVTATSRSPSPSPGLAPAPSPSEHPGKYTLIDKKDYLYAHVFELGESAIFSYMLKTHHFGLRLRSVLKAEFLKDNQGGITYRLKMNVRRIQRGSDHKKYAFDCVYGALVYWNRNLPKHSSPFSAHTISFHPITCQKMLTFAF